MAAHIRCLKANGKGYNASNKSHRKSERKYPLPSVLTDGHEKLNYLF